MCSTRSRLSQLLRLLWACLLLILLLGCNQHPYDADFFIDRGAANLHALYTTQLCFGERDKVNTSRVLLVLKEAIPGCDFL